MPIITEPKKLSMPQQVQKNKEDIESIFKIIDGLDAMDNVVVVPDISYILSADELKSVRQPVAFIVYNNNVYLKRKEESNTAYFDRVFSIALSTVITFNSEEIVVDLTNGALGINNTSVNTYSVSQIDTKFATISYVDSALATKASLSGANFTGAITAPSIIEDMSGYGFALNTSITGYTLEAVYAGAVKNGNKVTFVAAINITRTEDGLSGNPNLFRFTIPSAIGAKLIPTQIGGYTYLANYVSHFWKSGWSKQDVITYFNKNVNSSILFNADGAINTALEKDTKYYLRVEATFLLSDSLAQ